ncbi:PPE family protein [Mycobacterium persicum]|uniref:PPE family protein PPE18 n=1 Tax=Mycobacterium persicum TaxID=1487726 RepID=A0A1X0LA95_9MYCO|nr:PPE family protein [Mycobacterium persicum]ORB47279.1 hypothetical protein BST40_15965 [Mycobacterium persicum]ORB90311.1 hypothetical protein B1T49_15010 [Mycobacterium persicum]ORB95727.1 hypothetical protein B1T44_15910 [Mycobacterium persicum]ORC04987.1 hypothetical protein B1T48_15730 [Mycobacterium persicum]ORC07696.1 hypothetical protein B4U45_14930 [Mycobacterium persicum]
MMDFGALPPEINSARMYVGPGAGSLLAAAAAWECLAADLYSLAASYESVISGLTVGSWLGPASVLMAAAAAPYVAWMSATATQAEQAGIQAMAAVTAFNAVFSMTVPPPVVAENRAMLMTLVATDIFGQNAAAIAATEAQYAEMWARDAAAMYGYAAASAAASTLTPFEEAPETTRTDGLARQLALVGQVEAAAIRQLMSVVPRALRMLSEPAPWNWLVELWREISPHLGTFRDIVSIGQNCVSVTNNTLAMTQMGAAMSRVVPAAISEAAGAAAKAIAGGTTAVGSASGGLAGSGLAAGLGRAASVGSLSVPQSWAATNHAINPAVRALPATSLGSAAQGAPGHMLGGLPLGPTPSGGGSGVNSALRIPPRAYVMPRIPAAG